MIVIDPFIFAMSNGNTEATDKALDKEEATYRNDRLLMRFMSNSSLLLKLVCGNIGAIIEENYNTEYNDAVTQKWLKLSQRFTDLVDFDDSYDSEDSNDSFVKTKPDNDILIYIRLIKKSLTLQATENNPDKEVQGKNASKVCHLDVMRRVVLLLECVLMNSALYDKRHPLYNDDLHHMKLWNEIYQIFSIQCSPVMMLTELSHQVLDIEINVHQRMAQRILNRLKWPLVIYTGRETITKSAIGL